MFLENVMTKISSRHCNTGPAYNILDPKDRILGGPDQWSPVRPQPNPHLKTWNSQAFLVGSSTTRASPCRSNGVAQSPFACISLYASRMMDSSTLLSNVIWYPVCFLRDGCSPQYLHNSRFSLHTAAYCPCCLCTMNLFV
ncbi:hypothetical protein VTK73DRAFT_8303 [Phialemonium thermophilum]|uniref:Uncharacterized protein n=1 Tax=Phialemonium thermophilum TaxID=223376 RepID=A0ABR3W963_9PEZI